MADDEALDGEEADPEDDDQVLRRPGDPVRNFRIFCDESGMHDGRRLVGYGTFWIPYERRGDLRGVRRAIATKHFPPSEVKWTKVKRKTLPFFLALVDEFFARPWMMFHCIVVAKADLNLKVNDRDLDLAHRKFFNLLLASKIKRFATRGKSYSIRVDPIQSSYRKADEAAKAILHNIMEQQPTLRGRRTIQSLLTVDSKGTLGVQMSDFLLGAVMAGRAGLVESDAKREVMDRIAHHLGWNDSQRLHVRRGMEVQHLAILESALRQAAAGEGSPHAL